MMKTLSNREERHEEGRPWQHREGINRYVHADAPSIRILNHVHCNDIDIRETSDIVKQSSENHVVDVSDESIARTFNLPLNIQ